MWEEKCRKERMIGGLDVKIQQGRASMRTYNTQKQNHGHAQAAQAHAHDVDVAKWQLMQREVAEAKADKTVKRCNNMVMQLQTRCTQAVHAEQEARTAMCEAKAIQASQAVALRRAHNLLSKQGGGGLEIGHTSDLLKELLLDSLVSVSTQTALSGDQATQAMGLLSRQNGMVSKVCQTDFQHEHVLLQKVDEHEALQNDLQLEVHKLQVEVGRLLHRAETAETQVPALHELLSQ